MAKARRQDVGEGFLYYLIQTGQRLPSRFETRKQREERQEQEREIETLRRKVSNRMTFSIADGPGQKRFPKPAEENHDEVNQPLSN